MGMNYKRFVLLVIFLLIVLSLFADIQMHSGMGICFQKSKNTLRLTPGIAIQAGYSFEFIELKGSLFVGALFGNSVNIALQGLYIADIYSYKPRIGIFLNCNFGSYMFFTESSTDMIRPVLPEFGLGIVVYPVYLEFDNVYINLFAVSVGTTFQYFGRVLIAECELFQLGIKL